MTERALRRGDRVLFYTDRLIEEHVQGGAEFGDTSLREVIERVEADGVTVQESVRRMPRLLMLERGGATTDDSTQLRVQWIGAPADDLALAADHPEAEPHDRAERS